MGRNRLDLKERLQTLGTAINDLLDPLSLGEVSALAIEAILEHRRRLAIAEAAYSEWVANDGHTDGEGERLKAEYLSAMLANRAQMALVAALVDHLGFVPSVPSSKEELPPAII